MQERVEVLLLVALLFMLAMSVFSFVSLNKKIEGLQLIGTKSGEALSPFSAKASPVNGMIVVQIVNTSVGTTGASP
ncbi:hypothetical protein HYU13_01310 [Candidatus Woesearchaeota archaeon]|nr:hypothetical protein [Candidatus Woesearchaeota archaeon]